jgi:hypothetical protein
MSEIQSLHQHNTSTVDLQKDPTLAMYQPCQANVAPLDPIFVRKIPNPPPLLIFLPELLQIQSVLVLGFLPLSMQAMQFQRNRRRMQSIILHKINHRI